MKQKYRIQELSDENGKRLFYPQRWTGACWIYLDGVPYFPSLREAKGAIDALGRHKGTYHDYP